MNVAPRKRNAPRPAWKVAESHLAWIRKRACYLAGHPAGGCGGMPGRKPIEPAHVDCAGGKGMGSKVADFYVIPLCARHHDEQHGKIGSFRQRGGWATFQLKYGFDAVKVAAEYWRLSPHRHKWEAENEQ